MVFAAKGDQLRAGRNSTARLTARLQGSNEHSALCPFGSDRAGPMTVAVRPTPGGQPRRPNCPEAVVRLGSVALKSAGEVISDGRFTLLSATLGHRGNAEALSSTSMRNPCGSFRMRHGLATPRPLDLRRARRVFWRPGVLLLRAPQSRWCLLLQRLWLAAATEAVQPMSCGQSSGRNKLLQVRRVIHHTWGNASVASR